MINESIKILAEFGNEQEKSILLQLPDHVIQGLSLDGKTVSTKHLLGALMLMEHEAALQPDETISPAERIDLLDAIYNPDRAATEKPVNRKV